MEWWFRPALPLTWGLTRVGYVRGFMFANQAHVAYTQYTATSKLTELHNSHPLHRFGIRDFH